MGNQELRAKWSSQRALRVSNQEGKHTTLACVPHSAPRSYQPSPRTDLGIPPLLVSSTRGFAYDELVSSIHFSRLLSSQHPKPHPSRPHPQGHAPPRPHYPSTVRPFTARVPTPRLLALPSAAPPASRLRPLPRPALHTYSFLAGTALSERW